MEKDCDKLTKAQKITVIVTIGVVFLGLLLQLLVRTWYSSDIRYERGTYYKLKEGAVVSCKLRNFGHKTANSIRVSVKFNSNISDVQIAPFTKYIILSGKIGEKELVIEIERIVPSSQVTIFYATQNLQEEPFIEKIEYDDNIAKTGKPVLWFLLLVLFGYALTPFLFRFILYKRLDKKIDEFYKNIEEAVNLAYSIKEKGLDEEELDEKFALKFKNVTFRIKSLKRIAVTVLDNLKRRG
jgi:hypothetical protein